jgi:hypothetical protein
VVGSEATNAARFAGKSHEILSSAAGAADPGEAFAQIPAKQKLAHCVPDDWPPKAIRLLVALWVDSLEFVIEPVDHLPEWRGKRVPTMIERHLLAFL